MILIMTVNPGYGGQSFLPHILEKIRALKNIILARNLNVDIEVDGGIKLDNLEQVLQAGANVIVAGSAVFNKDTEKSVKNFLKIIKKERKC